MPSHEKNADDGHFWESTTRCENPTEKPVCTHGTVLSSLVPPVLQKMFHFSLPLLMEIGIEIVCQQTLYATEGELKLKCSHTAGWAMKWPSMQAPLPCLSVGPQGLCSAPLTWLCCAHPCSCRFLQLCSAWRGMQRHSQGHVRSTAKDTVWRFQLCPLPPLPEAFVSAHNVLFSLQEGICCLLVLT